MKEQAPESAPASDTVATNKLAEFVRARRSSESRKIQPLPGKLTFSNLEELTNRPAPTPEEQAAQAKRALAREQAARDGAVAMLVAQAGRRYASATFLNFVGGPKQAAAVEYVESWCSAMLDAWEFSGLLLYGPVGTGKDHLAIAACRQLILERGKSVAWINGQAWFGEIRDSMDSDDRTEAAIIRRLSSPDLLVVSDPLPPFGDLTQHQATMLYRAVDARYSQAKPTICTVNVADDEEAERRMGVATWDRLCHDAWKLNCSWPSFRKPRA